MKMILMSAAIALASPAFAQMTTPGQAPVGAGPSTTTDSTMQDQTGTGTMNGTMGGGNDMSGGTGTNTGTGMSGTMDTMGNGANGGTMATDPAMPSNNGSMSPSMSSPNSGGSMSGNQAPTGTGMTATQPGAGSQTMTGSMSGTSGQARNYPTCSRTVTDNCVNRQRGH